MTPERWQTVEAILQDALDLPPQDRAAFLSQACSEDDDLKREATTLISAYEQADDFIEEAAIVQDARVLIKNLPDLHIGRVVGSYRLIDRLGSGGMGEVYLAEDTRLSRLVALKILPGYFVSDEARLRRFQAEARAVSALNHPNILTIHEIGQDTDGDRPTHFIATEFIDGQTIRELITQQTLTLDEILDISIQVGSGLTAAHAAGIIHRDVKPENIMRREDGLVKVLDFGIAKSIQVADLESEDESRVQTEVGIVLGTVGYMSPEQARGLPLDERTDVWSLGVVLYEMLSGRGPFKRSTRMDTLVSILEHEPEPLSPVATFPLNQLQQIIDRSLQKDVKQRYPTVLALLSDLKDLRKERDVLALPQADRNQPFANYVGTALSPKSDRGRKRWPIVIAAILVSLAVLASLGYWRRQQTLAGRTSTTTVQTKLYQEMTDEERLKFLAEEEQRVSAMMGDRPVKLNDDALKAIKSRVDRYVARKERAATNAGAQNLEQIYQRAIPFVPLIGRSFADRKVPVTIGIYLPMIESEYRTCFESPVGAKGLYQFLPSTAKRYGVAYDEMCDAEKMTPAAAHYIADLMAELGEDAESLTLVLLSYNQGETWVRDTLRQLRGTPDFERNFWTLYAHRNRLDESFRNGSGYVPSFFAAAIIGENPKAFGLNTPPLSSLAKSPDSAR